MATYKDFGETAEYYGWGAVPDAWRGMGDAMTAPGSAFLDFLGQAARGFPGNAPTQRAPTPGFDQLTGSEMDREWGWTAPPALGGGGAGRAGRGSSQEAINQAASATAALGDPNGGWWDRMQDRVYNFGSDVVPGLLGGVVDAGQWVADPMYQAGQELLEGDLSGAIGDYLGGRFNQARDVAGNIVATLDETCIRTGASRIFFRQPVVSLRIFQVMAWMLWAFWVVRPPIWGRPAGAEWTTWGATYSIWAKNTPTTP